MVDGSFIINQEYLFIPQLAKELQVRGLLKICRHLKGKMETMPQRWKKLIKLRLPGVNIAAQNEMCAVK